MMLNKKWMISLSLVTIIASGGLISWAVISKYKQEDVNFDVYVQQDDHHGHEGEWHPDFNDLQEVTTKQILTSEHRLLSSEIKQNAITELKKLIDQKPHFHANDSFVLVAKHNQTSIKIKITIKKAL